jgi:CRP/FNR family cyclic AMP-dependent transcriptional regulator
MADPDVLDEADLFKILPEDARQRVREAASVRLLRRGELLFREGADSDALYVVRKGRIAMETRSPDGRESVIAIMEAGDLFGELPLFDGQGRSADARSLEASEVLEIHYGVVRAELTADPALLWGVVAILAERLRSVNAALADAVFLDVTGRTAKRLLEVAGDDDEFQLHITQETLAGLAGASRERVNKAIASFIKLGWISQRGRRYTITNREQLTRRAR